MTRYIACPECGDKLTLHPDDKSNGYSIRKVEISKTRRPAVHQTIIESGEETVILEVPTVVCDLCNEEVMGKPSVAITIYQGEDPGNWEWEFKDIT